MGRWGRTVRCRSIVAACAAGAALALGACGGDDEPETTAAETTEAETTAAETTTAETTETDTAATDDEAAVEQVVTDFGLAEGSTACDYVSQEYLSSVGGRSGCDKEFAEAVGVKYAISNVQVNGDTATAQAETDDQTIAFELVRENGVWKISSAGPG